MIENAYVVVHNPDLDYYSFTGHFIADSGASIHLVNDYKMLIDPVKCEPRLINTAKSGTQVQVDTKGSVRVLALNHLNQNVSIDIPNVFYCPELAANLLSIKQIIKSGADVSFLNNTMTIEFKNEDIHISSVTSGNELWMVSIIKPEAPQIAGLCANIWHARFGHPSTGAYRQYRVDGGKLPDKSSFCSHCVKGKIQRKPFKSHLPISSRPLYRIYSDIMGPMPVPSNNGSRYILTFIDCCTRYSKIYLIKKKSDTLSCFKDYVNTAENLMSSSQFKVSFLHTDRGGEYNSNEFNAYTKSKGISIEQAPANTPQQNGVAERYNRTLIQKVLAIMSAGHLPKWLWGEIAVTAATLINVAPSSTLNSDTPHRLWWYSSDPKGSHHKFDYSHLRTIGCRAYAVINKEKRDKLTSKASELIMIGYDLLSKAYRLLDPTTKKIIISRNVDFNETHFPYSVTSQPNNSEVFDFDSSDALLESLNTHSHVTENDASAQQINQRDEQNPVPDDLGDTSPQNNSPQPTNTTDTSIALSRPTRSCGRPDFYGNPVAHMSQQNPDEPTYRQAMASENREQWIAAMQTEFNSLVQYNVGELVELPPDGHHIGGMWRLKVKRDQFGEIIKYKARWVAFGNHQIPGVDFDQTYASVGISDTLRILLALTVNEDLEMEQFDIATAFLNGRMEHSVYIQQAHRQFNIDLKEKLLSLKFTSTFDDDSLYIHRDGDKFIYIHMHVDDGLVFSNSKEMIAQFKEDFMKCYSLKWNENPSLHLGLKITRDRPNNRIMVSQEHYLKEVLKRFDMSDSNPNKTPLPNNITLEKANQIDNTLPFQQAIGCLSFAAICTRPDIQYAVNYLARFSACYDRTHWTAVKHLLRYVKGTIDRGIIFAKNDESPKSKLTAYTDADYDSCTLTRRSTTGHGIMWRGCLISWKSKRQRTVALSTTEAEYMAISDAAKHLLWMRRMISLISQTPMETADVITDMELFNDNNGAVFLSQESAINQRSKHIDIRYHFIRDLVKDKKIRTSHIDTKSMPADMLTKNAGAIVIDRCRKIFNIVSLREISE
ncbi:hypothetical protein PGT21_050322 [Puccinia graminis f. sp. tritici]|uniref:Integrase catalytic domain-containing protein n=1 Tax=Puccinia graminis f. sp. tritici TaxID=56615 RepID=A0A5B0M5T4_PUCGR|nr:hypothetical protein PGT21_050322 [Puccinia graminis f. sp. tritici]